MYVPVVSTEGSNVPLTVSPLSDQYPYVKGAPFKMSIKLTAGSVSQNKTGSGIPTVPPASPGEGPPKESKGPAEVN